MSKIKGNSIGKNVFHLFYSTALTSALNASSLIVLAYYLQSYHYGMFSVVLAFSMIMGYFTDAGLSEIVLREGSKKDVHLTSIISSYIKMRAILLVVTFIVGFSLIEAFHSENAEMLRMAYILAIPMVIGLAMQSIGTTFFQLTERMQYSGLIRITSAVCLISTISVGMLLSLNPIILAFLYGASYLIAGTIGVYLVSKNIPIRFQSKFHKGLLQNLGSFTLGGLLFVILPHLGPIILEKTLTLKEVGYFAVAYRIPQALQQIPFIVAGAYYPVLFRFFNNRQDNEHLSLMRTQLKIMAIVGMFMTIPFYHMSEWIIQTLFGAEWLFAAAPLKILSVMLTLQAVGIALADGLTTRALQFQRMMVQFLAVLIGVMLYTVLSKEYGIIGAAYSGVTIELVALMGFWIFTPRRLHLAKKVLIPYLTFFGATLYLTGRIFPGYPFIAAVLHLLLVIGAVILDKELKNMIGKFIGKYVPYRKWKAEKIREVENEL
ncbi:oligosaccharide flippase family protein [Bacillus tianshenii]|uniref:oligosaccharide flippase family protein n=1 Tax=Sutcliffiella tianshenii TaxID=1463404 RepID=UPI001CD71CBE|nr:oligosaccharide flippase family protein [Bacillus tianshenii]MCA1321849.1 oligosaccharide flippase family protein [Bacillus tianshenii]